MLLKEAFKHCPSNLVVLPYDFELIRSTAFQTLKIIQQFSNKVQPLSCDEFVIDWSQWSSEEELIISKARELKSLIFQHTQCTCSVGISKRYFVAKIASRRAKPDGLLNIYLQNDMITFINSIQITELSNINYDLKEWLDLRNIIHLNDLIKSIHDIPNKLLTDSIKNRLCAYFDHKDDPKIITSFNNFFIDDFQKSSLSVSMNFGIRLQNDKESYERIYSLTKQFHNRLIESHANACKISLKVI